MLPALGRAAAALLALQVALAAAAGVPEGARATGGANTAPALTIKERLGSKASDDQRVNNCKVPIAQRGLKPRPEDCRGDARPTPKE
jgi:hypothetical protein